MTFPTPARRGRPPLSGGPATPAQRSAKSRATRGVVTVELDADTVALVDAIVERFTFASRVEAVRFAILGAYGNWSI